MTDKPKKYQLKPCPFCGGIQCAQGVRINYINENVCYIQCRDCGIETGTCTEVKEAIVIWNRRDYEKIPDQAGGGWISVEDRIPPAEHEVLVISDKGYATIGFIHMCIERNEAWQVRGNLGIFFTDSVRYWHELPKPPASEV